MMGTKRLSEIKQELRQALREPSKELEAWLDQEALKLKRTQQQAAQLSDDLKWARKILREAVGRKEALAKKPSQRKARSRR